MEVDPPSSRPLWPVAAGLVKFARANPRGKAPEVAGRMLKLASAFVEAVEAGTGDAWLDANRAKLRDACWDAGLWPEALAGEELRDAAKEVMDGL